MFAWLPLYSVDKGDVRLECGEEPLRFEFKLNRSTSAAKPHLPILLFGPLSECRGPGKVCGLAADRCDIVMSFITFVTIYTVVSNYRCLECLIGVLLLLLSS